MSGVSSTEGDAPQKSGENSVPSYQEEMSGLISTEGYAPQKSGENSVPSYQEEEELIKKKYGGMLPKKPPLISKDHERAFFDSADWALGKQGGPVEKPKGPLEALRPKLQPTQQQARSRRSAYAPASGEGPEDGGIGSSEHVNSSE